MAGDPERPSLLYSVAKIAFCERLVVVGISRGQFKVKLVGICDQ